MGALTSIRRAFTLVELLVVIGIVIVLAGIIATAGRAAIHATKVTVCSNNLSQIGKALEMYVADHDGFIPPYFSYNGGESGFLHKSRRDLWKKSLLTYGASDDVFYCPLDDGARKVVERHSNVVDHTVTSYSETSGVEHYREEKLAYLKLSVYQLEKPSLTTYLMDGGWNGGKNDVTMHGEMRNLLYFDGHVKEVSTHFPWCFFPGQMSGCEE